MSRITTGITVFALATVSASAVSAADWGASPPVFKPAFATIEAEPIDTLSYELGIRYFYGMGGQSTTILGGDYSTEDASHFLEIHGLIEDSSTSTYLQGNLGYAAVIDGTYRTPSSGGDISTDSGMIGYAGVDFGYLPFDTDTADFGAFVGYQYLNESIDMGRASFMTETGGFDSEPNLLEVHGLRLGVTGRADLSDVIDVRVDAAAIPYAALNGTYGAYDINDFDPTLTQGGSATITGHLYGGAIEAMVGFKPHENFAIRAGARGYYLTGPTENYVTVRDPLDPGTSASYVEDSTIELFRWGPVIELTGRF